jgi:hypothetical protein
MDGARTRAGLAPELAPELGSPPAVRRLEQRRRALQERRPEQRRWCLQQRRPEQRRPEQKKPEQGRPE